ncbi:Protein pim1 [Lachnellula cervina]|uniref:Protein pim1 n=1 Tax=Lachnellula cervina TaxID=1316786 RepID=A0A7D8UV14_9HELO|nr:Protein pim1 [Lachnellula cervina]
MTIHSRHSPTLQMVEPNTRKATATIPPGKGAAKLSKNDSKRKFEDGEDIKPVKFKQPKTNKDAISASVPKNPKKKIVESPLTTAPSRRLDLYVFGGNSAAELGLGPGHRSQTVEEPLRNDCLSSASVGVVQVATGGMHCVALTFDNKILTWGGNDHGALGRDTTWDGGLVDMDGSDSDSEGGQLNPRECTPTEVDATEIPAATVFTQVAAGDNASFAVTNMGQVYGWGTFRTIEGGFGFSPAVKVQERPTLVPELKKITKVVVGSNHALALTSKGTVFVWGWGQQGQLGRQICTRRILQSLVPREFSRPKKIVDIGAGSEHSFAVAIDGTVYGWGSNSHGQTGMVSNAGEGEAVTIAPTAIKSLKGFGRIMTITGGNHHSIAVTDKQECLVWGRADNYALGIEFDSLPTDSVILNARGKPGILKLPTRIPDLRAVFASSGSDHCIAIAKDHRAFSWGFNNDGQTGQVPDKDKDLTEVEVATLLDPPSLKGKTLVWAGAGGQFSIIATKPAKAIGVR